MDNQTPPHTHPGLTFAQQASVVFRVLSWLFLCWLALVLIAATKEAKEESVKNGKGIDVIIKKLDSKAAPVIIVGDQPQIQPMPPVETRP